MEAKAESSNRRAPVREVFTGHWRALLIGLGVASLNAVGFYLVLSYMLTYLTAQLGIGETTAFTASSVALLVSIGSIFVMGHLSDTVGRRKMLLIASVLLAVLTVPVFLLLRLEALWVVIPVQIVFGILLTTNDGTLATFLSELFPTSVRYTGFALSFNVGPTRFWVGSPWSPSGDPGGRGDGVRHLA